MSYIGNTSTTQTFTPAIDYFSGNGSTVAFTLSRPVASVAQVTAVIENVPQNPASAFTVNGNTITFTSAPPSGTSNIYVYYTSPITQVIAPSDGTVGAVQMASGAALANIGAGGVTSTYLASGAARANFGAGAVLQVVQAISSTQTNSTSTSFSDVAGMSLSITPSSASNKILVLIDAVIRGQASDSIVGGLQILREDTAVHTDNNAYNIGVNANVGVATHASMNYLDSPNTTSSVTYKLQLKRTSSSGISYNFSVNPYGSNNKSVITLMEIAG